VTVLVIKRTSGKVMMNPPADAVLEDGDKLRVFGLPEQIAALSNHRNPRRQP
jgi:K+/H+ antiporter YhaU regulatory subunit KhtT